MAQLDFRNYAAQVVGVDLDPAVTSNPYLARGIVANAAEIPCPDSSFDVVISCSVLEHLDQPLAVFREIQRVLKPAGRFIFKTPNFTHYMPVIATIVPNRYHARIIGRREDDTFPTLYRANSVRRVRKLAEQSGLVVEKTHLVEGRPNYLVRYPVLFPIGVLYERLVNSTPALAGFRGVLIAELLKSP